MYAVFETGGKQYRAIKGKVVRVEKTAYEEGKSLEWTGTSFSESEPHTLKKVIIQAEPLGVFKEDKVIIFKKKRRHNYRRKQGHRQQLLHARITEISELSS